MTQDPAAIAASSNVAGGSQETFTIEKLMAAKRLVEALPPAPVFASWEHFPADYAIQFKDEGRDYVGAHPDFWAKLPKSEHSQHQSLGAIQIIDLRLTAHGAVKAKFLLAMRRATLAILEEQDRGE